MGLVVAIVIVLRNSYKNSHFLHREPTGSGAARVKMTLTEEVVFLNKGKIKKELSELPQGTQLTIDMSKSYSVDYDVLEIIDDFKDQAKNKNIHVTLIGSSGNVIKRDRMTKKESVREVEFERK